MKTIGLVGGVASGKSRVAAMLVELGAGLLDADRVGHDVLASDMDVHSVLRQRWGEAVFRENDSVNRDAIAERVFGAGSEATEDRRFLEELLHPRIRHRLEAARRQFAAEGRLAAVLDAPLLLEVGWGAICDVVVMIEASRETRFERARTRGWTEAEFARREAAQWSVQRKRQHADFVINNDGTEAALRHAVAEFWQCASIGKL